jgi:hypothetical protein
VAVTLSRRFGTLDTLTAPIGISPSTSRSMLDGYADIEPLQARPAARAATRSAWPVLAAHTEVDQLLRSPRQPWP